MSSKLRILHLEDSAADCDLIRQLLVEEGLDCEIKRYDNHPGFVQALEGREYDLIFADCALPQFSGLHALHLSRKIAPDVPFIFVSGTMGEETAIESLRDGATDYVLKQRLSRLVPAVRRALAEASERSRNREMERQLRQAQRLEAVGTLAGGVAHDFNNILTIIKGHVSLLPVECAKPERVVEISATIDRAAQRGTDLVKQLLAFARKSDGSFTPVDVNRQVREIVAMLREAFPRNVNFEMNLDGRLPEIQGDPGQLERVMVNLATNARDAMPNGGVITFSTGRMRGDQVPFTTFAGREQPHLCLSVADTGTGMDEETRQHIFEPFFTTKPQGKGTGLGMPVVYGLMQSHKGLIDVWSEKGKGTKVSLFFPIPENMAPIPAKKPVEPDQPAHGTETVLLVDDESDVCHFMEIILQAHGYRVLAAPNAEEALKMLKVRGPEIDLIFSDLGLPKMDGFGLSAQVRQAYPRIKIILTSGYLDAKIKSRMAELAIDGFMSKPYDTPALLGTLRSTLDAR